jgi:hypothetical protein
MIKEKKLPIKAPIKNKIMRINPNTRYTNRLSGVVLIDKHLFRSLLIVDLHVPCNASAKRKSIRKVIIILMSPPLKAPIRRYLLRMSLLFCCIENILYQPFCISAKGFALMQWAVRGKLFRINGLGLWHGMCLF